MTLFLFLSHTQLDRVHGATVMIMNITQPQLKLQQVPSSWLECSIYQNYTAPEVLVQVTATQSNRCLQGCKCLLQGLAGVVNQGDVELMARIKNYLT